MLARYLLVTALLTAALAAIAPSSVGAVSGPPEAALGSVVQMDISVNYSCARMSTGRVRCWGVNRPKISRARRSPFDPLLTSSRDRSMPTLSARTIENVILCVLSSSSYERIE